MDVLFDLVECPGKERVELEETSLVNLERLQRRTIGTLRRTSTSDDRTDVELLISTLTRLDLHQIVPSLPHRPRRGTTTDLDCEIIGVLVPLPESLTPPFLEIDDGAASFGFVYVHLDPVPLLDLCHELVRLREVVEGVDEDEGWLGGSVGCDLGEHIDGDEASETECGGLVEIGKVFDGPLEDLGWVEGAEVVVDGGEGLL